MEEPQVAEAPKRPKGMLGFYVGTAVVVGLLVAGYFAWTPLKVMYLESQVRKLGSRGGVPLAMELAQIGPQAEAAFRRLQGSPDAGVRHAALAGMDNLPWEGEDMYWRVALVFEATNDKNDDIADRALRNLCDLSGKAWKPPEPEIGEQPPVRVKEHRRLMLEWWEREGRAKYGSSQ